MVEKINNIDKGNDNFLTQKKMHDTYRKKKSEELCQGKNILKREAMLNIILGPGIDMSHIVPIDGFG